MRIASRLDRLVGSWTVERCAWLGTVALVLVWAAASVTWPFGWDQGILASVGSVINAGGLPFRDAWDIKGPIAYYVYALAQRAFGHNLWGIRVLDFLISALGAGAVARYVARLTDATTARWTWAVLVLAYASGSYWHTAQPDWWAGLMLGVGILPLGASVHTLTTSRLLVSGALIGSAGLIKPFYGAFLGIGFLAVWLCARRGGRSVLAGWATLLAGFVLPLGITIGWFAWHDALHDLTDVYLRYAYQVYAGAGARPLSLRLRGIAEHLLAGKVVVVAVPAVLLGTAVLWRKDRACAVVTTVYALGTVGAVAAQSRFFEYHWLVMLPPVAILAAVGFHAAWYSSSLPGQSGDGRWSPARAFVGASLLVLGFHACARPLHDAAAWFRFVVGRSAAADYLAHFGSVADELLAAEYLREHTQPDDRIEIWGWSASVPYLAKRGRPTRFIYSMPLVMGAETSVREAYRREFLRKLDESPPAMVVVAPVSREILGGEFSLDDFPSFRLWLEDHYEPETVFGELVLLRRRAQSAVLSSKNASVPVESRAEQQGLPGEDVDL